MVSSLSAVIAICALFALQHSLLVTDRAKALARRALGEEFVRAYYRIGFTLVSLAALAVFAFVFVMVPDTTLWSPPIWLVVIMRLGQAGAAVFAIKSFTTVSLWEFIGLRQAWSALRGDMPAGDIEGLAMKGLVTDGSYRYVRHPLYLAGILIFTLNPEFTLNRITLAACADMYFIAGAMIEEKRLLARFGEDYRRYMNNVPRFIPSLRRVVRRSAR